MTGFFADEEEYAAEEAAEEETEETEAPTEAPTQAPTQPPKPSPAKLGYSAYAAKMDETVYSNDDLGATYTPEYTKFKLWSPAADDVKVCIYKTGSDDEEGYNTIAVKPMKYAASVGTWHITLDGDYKNMYYTYKVTIGKNTYEVVDPYAKAVGVNGNRGMIVDLRDTDPEGWSGDSFTRVFRPTDAVIWEVNVRDFSASVSSGVSEKNRGKFLAFTESYTTLDSMDNDITTCVAYLKELGVNYVQINPFYDFASIDEAASLSDQYNWGYDPKNYNVPEGSYSTDPYDGRVRITECKQMIQALHEAGIGVIMDVVYNHTYDSEESFFNRIVPAYYYRINEDGSWSNGSGCGNDTASERFMVSKFIRESVSYWAEEYHIDGFRFDLMGLIDVDTMNGIRADLNALPDGDKILMYGEAWKMETSAAPGVQLADQSNMHLLDSSIGAFNDSGRDAIKGSNFNASEKGFVQSGSSKSGVRGAIEGTASGWAQHPSQCVNYVSCHDNLTLYDKLTASVYGDKKYELRREDLVSMDQLAAAAVMMSRGTPFMLAGEELGRTKEGDENSYISPVEINQIDWRSRYRYTSMTDYYAGLIGIRNAVPALRDADGGSSEITYLKADSKACIAYTVSGSGSPVLAVALNGDPESAAAVTLPDGDWIIIADKDRAGLTSLGKASGSVSVPASSACILMDAEGFEAVGQEAPESLVYLRLRDSKNGDAVVYEGRLTGALNEKYEADIPSEIKFNYNIKSDSALKGTFSKSFDIIDVECEEYEGDFSTVTIKFAGPDGDLIDDTVIMTNRVGQQYFTPSVPGVTGYSLDLDDLPENGAGKYTDDPIEVVYHYKAAENDENESEQTRHANVIYLAEDGSVLDIKSYTGVEGDKVGIEDMEFDGFEYYDISNENAVFAENEVNVLIYYMKQNRSYTLYILITAGVILLIVIAAVAFRVSKKRRMTAIDIDE